MNVLTAPERKRTVRNLVIFSLVTLGCGFLGSGLDRLIPPADSMQGPGILLWLVSPLLANILLRALGGDGWADFGVKPNLVPGWRVYVAALLIIPLVTLLLLAVSAAAGTAALSGSLGAFLPLAGAAFVGSMVKNLFEEFSWRGYLTPRLAALGLPAWSHYLITGLVWAGWHIPYYLYFLPENVLAGHTSLSVAGLILLALLLLPFQSIAYGELRLSSGSVWPAWLMHNVANAISLTLVSGGFLFITSGAGGVLLSPGSEGVLYSLLLGAVGYALYRRRTLKPAQG